MSIPKEFINLSGGEMLMFASTPSASLSPTPQQIADLRLAATQMTGATRRAFQAEMTLKYSGYSAFKFHQVLTRVPAGRLVKVIYNKGIIGLDHVVGHFRQSRIRP
jgi:hypothetical protein